MPKIVKKAYKYRLYPNQEQERKMNQSFGCVRFVWNNLVHCFNDKDEKEKTLPELKVAFNFLNDVSCAILQQKIRDFIEFKKQFFNPNRHKKQKSKVAKIHQKIANQRSHFLHQITNLIVLENDKIVIEDLNVKGMSKNRKLSKSMADASFAMFRQQLTYKCAWYGKELVIADRFYPSSKTCSCCGQVKTTLELSQRTYHCDHCNLVIDRDLNAALNLSKWTPLEKNIAARVKAA